MTRSDTESYLSRFILSLPVVFPTISTLRAALDLSQRFSLSHLDSMLLAACVEAGVKTLYSEDLSNGVTYGTVKVLNPFAS